MSRSVIAGAAVVVDGNIAIGCLFALLLLLPLLLCFFLSRTLLHVVVLERARERFSQAEEDEARDNIFEREKSINQSTKLGEQKKSEK